jgi:uncharacterized protein (DUF1015 family)
MSTIVPFQALRPVPDLASQVASRPYDVLDSREAREEAADNPTPGPATRTYRTNIWVK